MAIKEKEMRKTSQLTTSNGGQTIYGGYKGV